MEREELIRRIKTIVGNKKLDISNGTWVEIGQYRPVAAVSKNFVYMASKCYIEAEYRGGHTTKRLYKIPLYKVSKNELGTKVELDCLDNDDLEKLYGGIKNFLLNERDVRLAQIRATIARMKEKEMTCERNIKRLKAIEKYG